jgi:hypothetical protein
LSDTDRKREAWKRTIEAAPEVDGQKRITAKLVSSVVRQMREERLAELAADGMLMHGDDANIDSGMVAIRKGRATSGINVARKEVAELAKRMGIEGTVEYQRYQAAIDQVQVSWKELKKLIAGNDRSKATKADGGSVSVLQRLAVTEPGKLAQIAYGLLPRDVFISVEQRAPGNLDPEGWSTLRRLLDLIQASGAGGEPQEIFAMIEEDLPQAPQLVPQ